MPAHVGSQGVERFRFQDAIHLLEEIRIGNVQRGKLRRTHGGEVTIQMEIGRQGDGLGAGHLMIAGLGIAARGAVHGSLGESGLDAQHGLRRIRGLLRLIVRSA